MTSVVANLIEGPPIWNSLVPRKWKFASGWYTQTPVLVIRASAYVPEHIRPSTGVELGGATAPPKFCLAPPKFSAWRHATGVGLSESPTQTIDSSPCCKTGPSSGPPKWKCLAPPLTFNNCPFSRIEHNDSNKPVAVLSPE